MIFIKFKNLEKSEMAREVVADRFEGLIEKFPDLSESKIYVTLEMENSRTKVGPDYFKVKLHVASGRFAGVVVEKANSNLYVALAELVDHMLEKINRFGDKSRVKARSKARQMAVQMDKQHRLKERVSDDSLTFNPSLRE